MSANITSVAETADYFKSAQSGSEAGGGNPAAFGAMVEHETASARAEGASEKTKAMDESEPESSASSADTAGRPDEKEGDETEEKDTRTISEDVSSSLYMHTAAAPACLAQAAAIIIPASGQPADASIKTVQKTCAFPEVSEDPTEVYSMKPGMSSAYAAEESKAEESGASPHDSVESEGVRRGDSVEQNMKLFCDPKAEILENRTGAAPAAEESAGKTVLKKEASADDKPPQGNSATEAVIEGPSPDAGSQKTDSGDASPEPKSAVFREQAASAPEQTPGGNGEEQGGSDPGNGSKQPMPPAEAAASQPAHGDRTFKAEAAGAAVHKPQDAGQAGTASHVSGAPKSLDVSVEPEGLGRLDIRVKLENGLVDARINASEPAGRELIRKNLEGLLARLDMDGINMGGISVALNNGRDEPFERNGSAQAEARRKSSAAQPEARIRTVSDCTISIFV